MDFVFDCYAPPSDVIELIWSTTSTASGVFTSPAGANWELVWHTDAAGRTQAAARGPESRASQAACPAHSAFFGITFKVGAFMPGLDLRAIADRRDQRLADAGRDAFWLGGVAWERPTFANADVFVERLVRAGLLLRDPLVDAALAGREPALSPRALQYRFVQATGLARKTLAQIERARAAAALLERGAPIAEAAAALGFYDQAHLTNALKRFLGQTPGALRMGA